MLKMNKHLLNDMFKFGNAVERAEIGKKRKMIIQYLSFKNAV